MDEDDGAHFERVRRCVIRGMEDGYISRGARLVCLSRMLASRGVDAITVMDTRVGFDVYDPAQISFIAGDLPLKVVKTTARSRHQYWKGRARRRTGRHLICHWRFQTGFAPLAVHDI